MHRKRNNEKQKRILAIFIIAVMVMSAFGFILFYTTGSDEITTTYGRHKITQSQTGYSVNINKQKYLFNFHPTALEQIDIKQISEKVLAKYELQISYDPENQYSQDIAQASLLIQETMQKQGINVIFGLTRENSIYPTITCETAEKTTIIFLESNETRVTEESENCYEINTAIRTDVYKLTDKLRYQILGVTN